MVTTIQLQNCNNFDNAKITIKPNTLNIKYGANGTGKSTIAKALFESINGGNISSLTPFKHKKEQIPSADLKIHDLLEGLPDELSKVPKLSGAECFTNVMMFNENYVNEILFKKDEVISNSFEIFIKTETYSRNMEAIDGLLLSIETTFKTNPDIDKVISDLTELIAAFGSSKTGISKAGKLYKGLGTGNKIENIPESLTRYTPFIKSNNPNAWIGWQVQGKNFINEEHDACPYCTSPISTKKDTISQVEKEYNPKNIEHLLAIQKVIERLGHYFSGETRVRIDNITKNVAELSKEQENFLATLRSDMETLRNKLNDAKSTTFFSLKSDPKTINDKINNLKIDLTLISRLDSQASQVIVNVINAALDGVSNKISQLQGQINNQNQHIQQTIQSRKNDINEFLKYAGYRYEVDILQVDATYRMMFKHLDSDGHVDNATDHLSYGERNAFSIVLFMYDCLSKNPDLIILDDPISSFDKTKKFAIMHKLFQGKDTFYGKTVLMFTHDIEPIIDIQKVSYMNRSLQPYNTFLNFKAGEVSEITIENRDLLSFAQICIENISNPGLHDVVKVIYLRRRYEIIDNKGIEYQLLSSLLHKRDKPTNQAEENREMTADEINLAQNRILNDIPSFNYANLLAVINDDVKMCDVYNAVNNRYEKLQLFRILKTNEINTNSIHENKVITKFINETFHIENELLIQLNPQKYDAIPEYIIKECDEVLLTVSNQTAIVNEP